MQDRLTEIALDLPMLLEQALFLGNIPCSLLRRGMKSISAVGVSTLGKPSWKYKGIPR
jgi:hypothetical protein